MRNYSSARKYKHFDHLSSDMPSTRAGAERVEELRAFFSDLKSAGAKLSIITKGNVGACRFLLQEEDLLQFFEKVFGMVGVFYGESEFDCAHPEPSELEGTPDCELQESKANLIRALMSREGLLMHQAALVEDDPAEIASVSGICESVFVPDRKGMTAVELEQLRSMTGARKTKLPSKAKSIAVPDAAREVSTPPKAPTKSGPAVPPPPPAGFSGVCHAASGKQPAPPPAGFDGVFKAAAVAKTTAATAPEQSPPKGSDTAADSGVERLVKHVYFDFDQTISRVHVFKQLAGWEPGVLAPHALSERGQIHRLKLLNDAGGYQYHANGQIAACPPGAKGATSWTAAALGGARR